jgi:hypothetical protein
MYINIIFKFVINQCWRKIETKKSTGEIPVLQTSKMVRPRGLDKAAEPLQSQPEDPAGNPPKKSPREKRIIYPLFAAKRQELHKKNPRNLFQRGFL